MYTTTMYPNKPNKQTIVDVRKSASASKAERPLGESNDNDDNRSLKY